MHKLLSVILEEIITLSFFSKIFEKLVHSRIISFLDEYNIINKNQFGFHREKVHHREFLDHAYDFLNNKQYLLAIILDFSKAVDTILFNILLGKLDYIRDIRGFMHTWLQSILSNRAQYLSISDSVSNVLISEMGVPHTLMICIEHFLP